MSVLVTGASGFVGTALIEKLLEKGHKVYGLSRHPPIGSRNLVPVKGDILLPDMGMGEVPGDIHAVVHCAALLSFKAKDKDRILQTNYQGTVNLLEFMRKHRITKLFHVSTAFLFDHNDYERSKKMAEEAIKQYPEISTTIIRPSIIIGDSRVEGLPPLSGFYLGIAAVDRAKRWFERKTGAWPLRAKIRIRGRRQGRLNLIPVDVVAENIVALMKEKPGIFYLTHPNPPTLRSLEKPISEAIGADIRIATRFKPNLVERMAVALMKELTPYLEGNQLPSDIECAPLDDAFLAMSLKSFLNQHKS